MIKVLVVIDNLNTGGVSTSFYNFLNQMSNIAEFDILVFNDTSINCDRLPSNITILPTQKVLHILGKTYKEIAAESVGLTLIQTILKIIARVINGVFARKFLLPFIREIGNYDLAIAYSQDDAWKNLSKGCVDFVINKCNAKFKTVIIHCDYKMFGGYNPKQIGQYSALDKIICISESCRKSFGECFPSLLDKIIVCENYTNVQDIKEKASKPIEYPKDKINFVTVCRLSSEKGLRRTVEAFSVVNQKGYINFLWTVVGDGPEKVALESLVREKGLENKILFVGNKINPYPYVKNASFFLLPSENEAAPMVFGESAVLGVPIITTNTCSAVELVENRKLGWVVENSLNGIAEGIENAIEGHYSGYVPIDATEINDIPHRQFSGLFDVVLHLIYK